LSDTTYSGPFERAADIYRAAGWHGTLPLGSAPGKKSPPPGGWTGHGAPYPSGADVQAWKESHGDRNIGLRMPAGVIGLDIDAGYTKIERGVPVVKRGEDTLRELEARFGPLPATWVSSARPAPSGIRFYRVPTHLDGREVNWPGEAGKFIEIIQTGHRYAVVWPSTNPDADGAPYEWRWNGTPLYRADDDGVFGPDELPWLPEAWVRGLMLAYDRAEKGDLGNDALSAWWQRLRVDGPMCTPIHSVLTKAVDELANVSGARHETARDALAAIVRFGAEGHNGTRDAVQRLAVAFEQAVGTERVAGGEWGRLLVGAAQLAAAAEPAPRQHCEHDAATTLPAIDAEAFFALAEQQRRTAAEARSEQFRTRADDMAGDVERLPFAERAAAVRALIPEIASWAAAEQGYARDLLTSRSGLTSLGVTEFGNLIKAELRAAKQAAEAAAHEAARQRHTEQVAAATEGGTLLPAPMAPMDVARALAARMTIPGRWWRGDYYLWTGTRYAVWDDAAVENWLYRQTESAVFESADDEGGTKPWRPTEAKITSVGHALSRGVLYRPASDDPDDNAHEIACANGVLDVVTGHLAPHDPGRFNLQAVAFDYDPHAKCPTWEWFLNDVLPADAQAFLQEWFGYVLSGRTDLEKIAHLQGLRRSGKGTTAQVLEALIGPENVAAPSIPSLVGTFGEQPLIGKTLAVFSDISWQHRDIVEGVEILKKISGNDSRDVNRKNREVWHGRLGVRFMIMGNDVPKFTDASGALAGRMIHIKFPGTFYGRERPEVKTDLMGELPGILNWALDGLRRLNANGRFTVPQSSEDLAAEVRRQQGPAQAFLEDECAMADDPATPPVPLDELFPVYRAWAVKAEVTHKLDKERFSQALGSAGLRVERKMINGVRARRVYGVVPQFHDGVSAWVRLLNPHGLTVPPLQT
jgi:putative DNA primase/helicase